MILNPSLYSISVAANADRWADRASRARAFILIHPDGTLTYRSTP